MIELDVPYRGVAQTAARMVHTHEATGSNPVPATQEDLDRFLDQLFAPPSKSVTAHLLVRREDGVLERRSYDRMVELEMRTPFGTIRFHP